jgi:nucleotide-binding universal stress UspA family protein
MDSPPGTILLATDFSLPARRAFVYATRLSQLLQRRLVLLHAITAFPDLHAWSRPVRRTQHQLRTKALLELGRMARIAHEQGVTVTHRLAIGVPEDSILKAVEQNNAALLVMGTHGRTGWDRLQLGSSAEAMIRKAPCPVLTVHGETVAHVPLSPRRLTLKRLLVATDFSAASEAALRSATLLARQCNARAALVYALDPAKSPRRGHRHAGESARRRADRLLEEAVAAVQAERYIAELIAQSGKPVEVILHLAKRVTADLIVMGTKGRRGMRSLMAGSVAEAVVRRAGCPVLVVKAGMRDRLTN